MTALLGTVLASMLVVLAVSPATAGGWWTYPQIDTEPMSPGEEVTVSATVMFPSAEAAEAARSRYYAYLVRGFDQQALQEAMTQGQPEGWWSTPDEILLLGQLEFGDTDTNLRNATGTFVVPEIESGAYALMLCTLGCTEPLGDVIPREGVYVGDAAEVRWIRDARETNQQLLGVFDDMEGRLQGIQQSVARVGGRVGDLETRVGEVGRGLDGIARSMGMLEERVDGLEAASAPSPAWPSWAGWFVAGLALAVAWSNRGTTTEPATTDAADHLDGRDRGTEEDPASEPEFVTSFSPR